MKVPVLPILLVTLSGFAPMAQVKPTEEAARLTFDGDRFHNDTVAFTSRDSTAFWFLDTPNQGKAQSTRIRLLGKLKDSSLEFQLHFPSQASGTFELVPGSGDIFNLTHWAFLDIPDGKTFGDGLQARLRKLSLTVTRYDAVGGLIEGRIDGTLFTTRNSPYREVDIHIEGKFSVRRGPDVKRM